MNKRFETVLYFEDVGTDESMDFETKDAACKWVFDCIAHGADGVKWTAGAVYDNQTRTVTDTYNASAELFFNESTCRRSNPKFHIVYVLAKGGAKMRYRLQIKEPIAMPCVIGNRSMPLPTYRWKDIAGSDDLDLLRNYAKGMNPKAHRIEDTERGTMISI